MQDDSDKMLVFELEQIAQGGPLAFNKATILEAIDRLAALLAERDEIEAMNQQQALRLMEQESARIAAETKLDAVTRDAGRTQARYEHARAWFLSGAMRTEILPHGHVKVYSEAEFDAAIDALTDPDHTNES